MTGKKMHSFARELWGLNRSITGEGTRETLERIKEHLPALRVESVKSGTRAFDWTVPREWEVKDAYIITPEGEKICDFRENNLHLLGYSIPVNRTIHLNELQKHLHSLPEQPDAIPYVTSYYEERWGFCISQNDRDKLEDGDYKAVIESRLFDGVLDYGDLVIKGASDKEVFLSTYICHPSMANDGLSGLVVSTWLAKWLLRQSNLRYTYRIVFVPETIGSIAYLSGNYKTLQQKVFAGFNVSCVGDDRTYSYIPSRKEDTISDEVAKHVLHWIYPEYNHCTWSDRGSDERQYCAPGIDLPIATIMKTRHGQYPEYHTSLDDLTNVVTPEGLEGGYESLRKALELLEKNETLRVKVLGEPQMGKRDLYPTLSTKETRKKVFLMMDFVSWCDGRHSLLSIANKLSVPAWDLYEIADTLKSHDLLDVLKL